MPMEFVISAHGACNFNQQTFVPVNATVKLYQPFGVPMDSATGFKLQTAICHPGESSDFQIILQANPPRALWNGGANGNNFAPLITLTPDTNNPKHFFSGLVRALDNKVIFNIDTQGQITLAQGIAAAQTDSAYFGAEGVIVHCLFCL